MLDTNLSGHHCLDRRDSARLPRTMPGCRNGRLPFEAPHIGCIDGNSPQMDSIPRNGGRSELALQPMPRAALELQTGKRDVPRDVFLALSTPTAPD